MTNYYLKPNIIAEPLMWQWYAWTHLIAPATAGCNILRRHIKIMESYLQAPELHVQAANNPAFKGGAFIDLAIEHVDEVEKLLQETKQKCAALITLAHDLKQLDNILQTAAQGDSLLPLYAQVPASLKGYVELVYDLNHHASYRLIEPLLYQQYYSAKEQEIAFSNLANNRRSFVLSTPRVAAKSIVSIKKPFNDAVWDKIFSARFVGNNLEKLHSYFDFNAMQAMLFNSLFTETPPALKPDRVYQGDQVRVRYFGHACVLLQTKNITILTDPAISYLPDPELPSFSFYDLPDEIDYVLLTHNHQDHVLLEMLLQLKHRIKHIIVPASQKGILVDPSLKLALQHIGLNQAKTLDELESITLPDGEIIGLPFFGEHADLNIQSKMAYFINLQNHKFILAADSNNLEPLLYKHLNAYLGDIDILFLGMECDGAPLSWLYGPLITTPLAKNFDKARALSGSNFERAWEIVQAMNCKQAYVYAMGQEPWLNYIMALEYNDQSPQIVESNKFLAACKQQDIPCERLLGKKEWLL